MGYIEITGKELAEKTSWDGEEGDLIISSDGSVNDDDPRWGCPCLLDPRDLSDKRREEWLAELKAAALLPEEE